MSDPKQALATLRNFVRRVTHWQEGKPDKHAALQALDAADDGLEWIEKGIVEWRDEAQIKARHLAAVQATARIAVGHLQTVLNKCRTADEQQRADTAARDWLLSIGSEPT